MFDRLKSFFKLEAASQLPAVAPIKGKPGVRSFPAFFNSTKPSPGVISQPDRQLISKNVLDYRSSSSTRQVIIDLVASSPELSNAVYTAVRLGVPEKYVAVARNMDGTVNEDFTRLLQSLIARFDTLGDPLEGYVGHGSLKSCSESMARDLVMFGQMVCELVLDKARMPYRLQPISSTVIQFKPDGAGVKPFQKVGDTEFDLDFPTVVIIQLDSNLLSPYATSPMETALKAVVFSEMFMADLTRVMRRAIHPRILVKASEESIRKHLSPEAQVNEEVAREELNAIIASIESKVNGLSPEDALIYLDSLDFEVETPTGAGDSYETLRDISNAKLASGSKTLPSVLGLESGSSSSNIASTEVAIYLRSVDSSVRQKLNEAFSRLFTIAIRLMGCDGYVTFEYEALSIRPQQELEAFAQTRQMRIMEQLETGMLTDVEACLMLTGKLPPPGYKPLSGTMFRSNKQAAGANLPVDQVANPSNGGSTLTQDIKPDTPSTGRGQNKKAEDDTPAPQVVAPNITMNIDNTQTTASVLRMRRDEDGSLIVEKVAQ